MKTTINLDKEDLRSLVAAHVTGNGYVPEGTPVNIQFATGARVGGLGVTVEVGVEQQAEPERKPRKKATAKK